MAHHDLPEPTLLDLEGACIAHYQLGEGPDLLFVHGWPVNAHTFAGVAHLLADRFTCHLIDLPGAGASVDRGAGVGLRPHAATLNRVIDHLGLQQVALVAHDSGASIARLAAAERPERVAALVLGDTEIPHDRPAFLQSIPVLQRLPFRASLLRALLRRPSLRAHRTWGFGSCFHDLELIEGAFYEHVIRPLLEDPQAMAGAMAFVDGFDLDEVDALERAHARIGCPVRFVWGARDRVFRVEHARRMLAQFAGPADLVELPDGRLFGHEEFPQAFVDAALPVLSPAFA